MQVIIAGPKLLPAQHKKAGRAGLFLIGLAAKTVSLSSFVALSNAQYPTSFATEMIAKKRSGRRGLAARKVAVAANNQAGDFASQVLDTRPAGDIAAEAQTILTGEARDIQDALLLCLAMSYSALGECRAS